jgi:hypothetical protein
MDDDRWMRAGKGSLAAPFSAKLRKSEDLCQGYWHVQGNRVRSNWR